MSEAIEIRSESPEQTLGIGRALGEAANVGDVIALCGALGAGKTQLVKGVAAGLGIPESEPVVSPTFVLVREYTGRLTLFHCDAYRLQSSEELIALGLDEMREQGVVALEWADRFRDWAPAGATWIELSHVGPSERLVRIDAAPTIVRELAKRFRA